MFSYETYAIIRNSQKLKDSDVSKNAGIPQSTFSDWKKGKSSPKLEKLQKIADVLGVYYQELMMTPEEYENHHKQSLPLEVHIKAIELIDNSDAQSQEELKMIVSYLLQLNDDGFDEAKKRIEELTQLNKYRKEDE